MSAKAILSASVSAPPAVYVEDVFSTFLYTGTGATQTITNGIDLAGKGGLVWIKKRDGQTDHQLYDTVRTARRTIQTNLTAPQETTAGGEGLTVFTGSGFTLGTNYQGSNEVDKPTVSWTFRNQPKFFDIVTYTGTGGNRTIAHNLGSVPGCIIIKRVNTTQEWAVYHRSLANTEYMVINTTAQKQTGATGWWNSTTPTSSVFSLGTNASVNANDSAYIAYLFAHDAGGFGTAGTDNAVSCGSFTTDGSGNATVNLGYEPQWLMVKASSSAQNWYIEDNMRAFNLTSRAILFPNVSNAEATGATAYLAPNSTGFAAVNGQLDPSTTYIYIAIRRGPMKTPTVGTAVFSANLGSTGNNTPGFVTDNLWSFYRTGSPAYTEIRSRLQGNTPYLVTSSTDAEITGSNYKWDTNNGVNYTWGGGTDSLSYYFRRAPGFFDVVAYTGTGSARTIAHNLGVTPELLIVKSRSSGVFNRGWFTYIPLVHTVNQYLELQRDVQTLSGSGIWYTGVTSSVFAVNTDVVTNNASETYIAYLFATLAGVSKVGSYTGNGTTQTIDCGFTGGARFVLIKRTDSTGSWYVWDTARGIISGNDPYFLINSTAAEVTGTDYIDPLSSGFEISSTAPAAINANGGSFIFLAIA